MTRITPVVVVSAFVLLSACGSRSGAVVPVVATDAIHSRLNEECRVGTDIVVGLSPGDDRRYDDSIVAVFAELSENAARCRRS